MTKSYFDHWTNTNVGYTFAIGGEPFFVDPSKEHTYQRGTAQFRKDQIDTSEHVGSNALDGSWVYGQLSFHNGAGVEFADASNPDLDSTCYETLDVDVQPGDATVKGLWVSEDGLPDYVDYAIPENTVDNSDLHVLQHDGTLSRIQPAGNTVLWTESTVELLASDFSQRRLIYYTRGANVFSRRRGDDTEPDASYVLPSAVKGLWAVKGRLLMQDSDGNFYTGAYEPGSTQTLTTADAWWSVPSDYFTDGFVACDSPGAVFLAQGSNVYSVSVDNVQAGTTWDAPTTAAQLPSNEHINQIIYYLGYVVLATDRGVRVAKADTSTGRLAYGPKIMEGDFTANQLVSIDTSVVVGKADPGSSFGDVGDFIHIDLSRPKRDGTFPYFVDRPGGLYQGMTVWNNTLYAYSYGDPGFVKLGPLGIAAHGYITTSKIRMGTLVPKQWLSVSVMLADQSFGEVAGFTVTPNGTRNLLFTWDLDGTEGAGASKEVSLYTLAPSGHIQFEFELTPDSEGRPPHFGGFQVKALPVPGRNRLIRVPLLIRDFDKSPAGVVEGHNGWAWERLNKLEQLEESASLVSFQDFRTGEFGVAYIESVQFENTTGPRQDTDGFGGVAMVTLRKIG